MTPTTNTSDSAAETRKSILQTARRMFKELGYRAVTTRRIAEACGLTQPALYHHFANKHELYVAVHREMLTEVRPALERIARRGDRLEDSLASIIRYLIANSSDDMSMLFHDLEHELDADARIMVRDLFRENVVVPIAGIFQQAVSQGLLRSVEVGGIPPIVAAYLLLSMVEGAAHMQDNAEPNRLDPAVFASWAASVLLNGLAKPSV